MSGAVDAEAAFAWRDFMVSELRGRRRRSAGSRRRASSVLRGAGRLAGPGTRRGRRRRRYTADHVVIATGSDAGDPAGARPARARRRLDQPRGDGADRGPAAAARAGRRAGRRRDGAGGRAHGRLRGARRGHGPRARRASRKPLGEALGRRSRPTAIELHFGQHAAAAGATATSTCSSSRAAPSCAATACSSPPAGAPRVDGLGLETVGVEPARSGIPVDERMRGRRRRVGDRRRDRRLAAHLRRQVPGPRRGGEHPRRDRARPNYDAVPRVVFTDPQAAAVGDADGAVTATVPLSEVPRTATYTRAYASGPAS